MRILSRVSAKTSNRYHDTLNNDGQEGRLPRIITNTTHITPDQTRFPDTLFERTLGTIQQTPTIHHTRFADMY